MRRRSPLAALAALAVIGLAGCTSSDEKAPDPSGPGSSRASGPSGTTSSTPGTPARNLYVSIGDSYAAGYQATGRNQGGTTRNGFAYQVVDRAKAKGYDLSLVNFGCSGATTDSVLTRVGCSRGLLGPGAPSYDEKSQADAAAAFMLQNAGRIGLITVSLGGNDIAECADEADPTSCVYSAFEKARSNLQTLVKRLRAAAGPNVPIVGITYPDVFLGALVKGDARTTRLAKLSVPAFRTVINPGLKSVYESADGSFADVTAATGGYGSLDRTTTLPPYGSIPVPAAQICRYTYFCQYGDIHPRTSGYAVISKLIVGMLPRR